MRSRVFAALALLAVAVPSYAYRMTAWVPSWDANAVTIMQTQAGNLQETNPGWYTLASDGTIVNNYKAEDPTMRAALTGTQLVPTIKNYVNGAFDGAMVAAVVADPVLREKHAELLTQLVVSKGFDGIDVDYEAVPTTAKANFSTFIGLLADKLHGARRTLSVTVHAKTSDTSTSAGKGAQDWRAIGAVADSVKIMAYDKHWSTSAAGPIAPLDWLGQVAAYAETTLPAGKAIIGLPWYGYDWLGTSGTSVTYAQAIATARQYGATITRDASGEATYTYNGRTVFFQDAAAYKAKVDFIISKYPSIAGFAAWRVGAEDPAIWPSVRELTMQSPAVRPAPQTFVIEGPRQLQVVAGDTESAVYGYTGINGFSAIVNASVKPLDAFAGSATLTGATIERTAGTRLVVAVPKSTPAGTYRLSVTMTGAGIKQEQVVTVQVLPAPTLRRRSVR